MDGNHNSQLSILNFQLSFNFQLSTLNSQLKPTLNFK